MFAEHGLTAPDFAVLVTLARIGEAGGVSQRRLMEELGLTSGTVSVRIDRLVDAALVERTTDPDSSRNVLITLTADGQGLVERVVPAHLDNESRLLASLDDAERDQLATLLRKLLVEFEGSMPAADAAFRLGLKLAPAHVTIEMRESVGLPAEPGLLVRSVDADGPAAAAGLRPGDVLVKANAEHLRSVASLYVAMAAGAADERLVLRLLRGNARRQATIRLRAADLPDGGLASTAGRSARGEHVV